MGSRNPGGNLFIAIDRCGAWPYKRNLVDAIAVVCRCGDGRTVWSVAASDQELLQQFVLHAKCLHAKAVCFWSITRNCYARGWETRLESTLRPCRETLTVLYMREGKIG